MAKTFTRIGREISIAVKEGGDNPEYNSRLRSAIQNAKAANMPKSNIESAIAKASSKDAENFDEIIYEGYGANGIAILVETATDNPNRTVANLRVHFSRCGGALGTSGSVSYMFNRKAVFKMAADGKDMEELEFELIDHGLEELKREEEELILYGDYKDFGTLQKALEDKKIETTSSALEWIPTVTKTLEDEQVEQIVKLIDRLEEDDDVLNVFHTMDES